MKKLFLVDAYALIFRYYYAFLYSPMRSPDGQNTSAIFGFVKFLSDIIEKQKPDCIGVAFDLSGGTFRNELYPLYKANRDETPEDIVTSAKVIKEILAAMRIHVLEMAGWEADDVIGTLSKRAARTGNYEVYVVSPDKDLAQLVDDSISIYKPGKSGKEDEILGRKEICQHYGISDPSQIIDILAIWGDAADNIPGVAGIGEKGASKLLAEWGTLENIISNVDKLNPRQAEKIKASIDQLRLARKLTEIALDVPIDVQCEDLNLKEPDYQALTAIYQKLGFRSLIASMSKHNFAPAVQGASEITPEANANLGEKYVIHSLFDDIEPETILPQPIERPKPSIIVEPEPLLSESRQYTTIKDVNHSYSTIDDEDGIQTLLSLIKEKGIFAFDTETTSIEPMRAELVGMSIAVEPHTAFWIRKRELIEMFRDVFSSEAIAKIGHNVKYDMIVMKNTLGIETRGQLWDTMLMHYILFPESRHSMDYISATLLSYEPIPIENLIGKGASVITMDKVDNSLIEQYAAEDADVTIQMFEYLREKVEESGKMNLYHDIEEPLIAVLVEMESNGVRIDDARLESTRISLSDRVQNLEAGIRELSTVPDLNINSPKQLGHVLYEVLNIDPKPKMTKLKSFKTDEETLLKLKDNHPIVEQILEYRGLKKLLSTYVEALPKLVNPKTNKIHTSFNQAVTATGRLSSSNPNLQNIPVRDEEGREIRKAFVASEPGWKIMSADYSQVELRIMAHLSKDRHLLEAFNNGEDIHAATAAKIFRKPVSEVTKQERSRAKVANFGIIYGISSFGLSERLQMPMKDAKKFIDDYYLSFPEVARYIDKAIADAKINGYVTTIFSRHRELPEIKSKNAMARKFAERNAVNAPIQGSAADIMKIAMARVYKEIQHRGLRSRMLLQIHDELVLEVPENELEIMKEVLTVGMSQAAILSVPLDVEVGIGDSWLDAH